MNDALRTVLSLSLSGSILGALLILARPLYRGRLSRRWQYYIWLVVLARLLLPLTPVSGPVGALFQEREEARAAAAAPAPDTGAVSRPGPAPGSGGPPTEPKPGWPAAARENLWLIWLGGALLLAVRKLTAYQSFVRYVRAGRREIADTALLDRLAEAGESMGVRRPVELYENSLVPSPMLLGFVRPCIILPSADLPEADFRYTVLHELTHYRRGDMFYKWLVQAAVCVHWFNPLVWAMSREIGRACELACDEAVLERLNPGEERAYGGTLLRALESAGNYRSGPGTVRLSESGALLWERLAAIQENRRYSKMTQVVSLALAAMMALGAVLAGAYAGPAERSPAAEAAPAPRAESPLQTESPSQLERYYEAGSLPLFQLEAAGLDAEGRRAWAEKLYGDGSIAFFSLLADDMDEAELEAWLDRALEDGQVAFQSMLYGKLEWYSDDWKDGKDAMEEELEAQQRAEYARWGVTWDGKDCYYQSQLVNIFLDIRDNRSFYTLDMNPRGTVNIKIIRNERNEITGVAYMTEAEAAELLEDRYDEEDEEEGTAYQTDQSSGLVTFDTVKGGESILLGEYTLSEGDRVQYDFTAEAGDRMHVFFARDGERDPIYWSVDNRRQEDEPLRCSANFTVKSPAEPGTYQMFLRAPDGELTDVTGSAFVMKKS